MKIAVCIKRVPDTAARIKIDAAGLGIDRTGLEYCTSPYDELAIERAVVLKEAGIAQEVVVFCLGPADATKEVRTALAMGADRAVHLEGDSAAFDAAATAQALADAIGGGFDLVLFGNKATDTDAAQVGARVAARLKMPFVNQVSRLEIADRTATLTRSVEGATETIAAELPLAIGAQKGLADPRYPALKGIMAAKKKPIETVAVTPPANQQTRILECTMPPTRKPGKIVGEGVAAVPELVRLLRDEAKVL